MFFLDCNLSYGPDRDKYQIAGCGSLQELKECMARAGIEGGFVSFAMKEATFGNLSLANELKGEKTLKGVISLLPSQTEETPKPRDLPGEMKKNNFGAITFHPETHRFLPRSFVIGDYLEAAQSHCIPVVLNTGRGLTLEQAADIMEDFPNLTAVLAYANCWPSDRELRPFLEAYPNIYLDMTYLLTDSGLPEMVEKYTARRILFGSGFPLSYMGAHMMVIQHADISEEDRALIAGENLRRIMEGVRYDK